MDDLEICGRPAGQPQEKSIRFEDIAPRLDPSHLCGKCLGAFESRLFTSSLRKAGDPLHYENVAVVQRSADSGCSLCSRLLQNGLMKPGQLCSAGCTHRECKEVEYVKPGTMTLRGGRFEIHVEEGRLKVLYELASETAFDFVPSKSSQSTKDALPLAVYWLNHCRSAHPRCTNTSTFIPTRLIDVRSAWPKLKLGQDLAAPVQYASLSHSWGNLKTTTLKSSNLATYQDRIPLNELPRTFQDAIFATRSLGLTYIWIDSLCIVQDSSQDWLKESVRMADVYSAAEINIAATGAMDGSGGCFFERPKSWRTQVSARSELFEILPMTDPGHGPLVINDEHDYLIERAWVFQERCLSRRTLFFARDMLRWECAGGTSCEIHPRTWPQGTTYCLYREQFEKLDFGMSHWAPLVERYSSKKLSYQTDKLVAISGLAKAISRDKSEIYVAGLWRRNLDLQLCWEVCKPVEFKGYDTNSYVAPTWSWASVNAGVRHLAPLSEVPMERYVSVKSADTQIATDDQFGPLRGASLVLQCTSLLRGCAMKNKQMPFRTRTHTWPLDDTIDPQLRLDVSFDIKQYTEESAVPIYLLPISSSYDGFRQFLGIVLEETGRDKGEYRRIGMMQRLETPRGLPWTQPLDLFAQWDLIRLGERSHFTDVMTNEHGRKEYFITVI